MHQKVMREILLEIHTSVVQGIPKNTLKVKVDIVEKMLEKFKEFSGTICETTPGVVIENQWRISGKISLLHLAIYF